MPSLLATGPAWREALSARASGRASARPVSGPRRRRVGERRCLRGCARSRHRSDRSRRVTRGAAGTRRPRSQASARSPDRVEPLSPRAASGQPGLSRAAAGSQTASRRSVVHCSAAYSLDGGERGRCSMRTSAAALVLRRPAELGLDPIIPLSRFLCLGRATRLSGPGALPGEAPRRSPSASLAGSRTSARGWRSSTSRASSARATVRERGAPLPESVGTWEAHMVDSRRPRTSAGGCR